MEQEARDAINNTHENTPFLPGAKLAPSIKAYGDLDEAFKGTEMVMVVIPTPFLRRFVIANREKFPVGVPIVCCSKGIEKVCRVGRLCKGTAASAAAQLRFLSDPVPCAPGTGGHG